MQARINMKICWKSIMSLSLKLHQEHSFHYGNICKIMFFFYFLGVFHTFPTMHLWSLYWWIITKWLWIFFHSKYQNVRIWSTKGHLSKSLNLPSKVVFHQSPSPIKGHLPSNVVFHQMSPSVKSCLPSKGAFHQSQHTKAQPPILPRIL